MFRTQHLYTKLFRVKLTIVVGYFVFAITAIGQTTPAELPTDCSAYSSIPLPAEATNVPVPKSAPACASYRSYRGIGRPVNYSEARACAWQERLAQKSDLGQNLKEPTAWIVGGSLVLADIYFNGAGVKRDIPLAMRFACESEEGMARLAMPDIAKLNGSVHQNGLFEFCDYAVTTFTMNFCNSYASEIEDDRRNRYYDSLKSSMTTEQKAAFEKLLAAQHSYIEDHASEVDQGGSIRVIRTIGSQTILENLFHTEVVHFERKKWPVLSDKQVAIADALLHHQYEKTLQKLQKRPKEESYEGAVTADHLSSVEKTWEIYRDAWIAFARLRYPAAKAAIRAEITLDRYRLLKTID
jgi:uncharacterized protein YecT (DUF1311 family)